MTDKQIPNERRLYEYKSVYTNTDNTIDDKIMENLHQPLIIDGVDVSGCEFRFCTYGCDCMSSNRETKVLTESAHCSDNHNCYYKQLKRKEQECEKLKETIDGLLKIQYQLADSCTKYERTLTEIKEIAEENFYFLDCDYRWILEKILQKISECEVENENKT